MRQRPERNGLNQILMMSAACVLFFTFFGYQVASSRLFSVKPVTYDWTMEGVSEWTAEDGTTLAVYFEKAVGARSTVFFLHGNDEDLGSVVPALRTFALMGRNVASLDYRGFGLSEGSPSERQILADARAYLASLRGSFGLELGDLILVGEGMGAGVAIDLALTESPEKVVLGNVYRSFFSTILALDWVPGDRFRNEAKASGLSVPVLFLHAKTGGSVPLDHAEAVADEVPEGLASRYWLAVARDGPLWREGGDAYWGAVRGFLSR